MGPEVEKLLEHSILLVRGVLVVYPSGSRKSNPRIRLEI